MSFIRKLVPGDLAEYEAHLLRLTPEDRAMRFAGGVGGEAISAHVHGIDHFRTVILGYFDDGVMRGAAEIVRSRTPWSASAELAVTVEQPWQGRGVGTDLVGRALLIARNRTIASLQALCVTDNVRMQRIVRKFDGRLAYLSGMAEGDIRLGWPTQFTLLQEGLGDAMAALGVWQERLP